MICSLENINVVVLKTFLQNFCCMSCIIVSPVGPPSPKIKFFKDYLMFPFLIFPCCSFSIISSISTVLTVPLAEKQPYPVMLQLPCLLFGKVFIGLNALKFYADEKFHFGAIKPQDTFPKF